MFVRSIRASTIKLVSITALAIVAIITLIIFIPAYESPVASLEKPNEEIKINFGGVKSDEDRIAFLSQFGYSVEPEAVESCEVVIPKEFDKVFASYNEMQKKEGLDLGRYKGKTVMRYTYKVSNYDGYDDIVYANILIYKNKVIGGDICSADPRGFAHGFTK